MTRYYLSVGALLAPVFVSAVPWNGPQPTIKGGAEIDAWSPAPTSPPMMYRAMNIFQKRQTTYGNTCGYENGDEASSYTCINSAQVCATNSQFGVHGCCDPRSLDDCAIPTTCYAASQMSSCTGDCLTDAQVARCTTQNAEECYNLLYDYGTTTMTEWGCNTIATTIALERTFTGENSTSATPQPEVPISTRQISTETDSDTDTETETDTAAPTSTSPVDTGSIASSARKPSSTRKSNTGAIAGGVVGGIAALALIIAAVVWLVLRNKKSKQNADLAAAGAGAADGSAPGAVPAGYHSPPMQQYPQAQYPHGGAFGPAPGAYGYAQQAPQGHGPAQSVDYKYAPETQQTHSHSNPVGQTQTQTQTQMLDGRPVDGREGAHELA